MREYTKNISESFIKGLRVDKNLPVNSDFLFQSQGLIPTEYGLEEPDEVKFPFHKSTRLNFPFPQLFVGKEVTLLCFKDTIYSVVTETEPWTYKRITIYNTHNSLVNIPEGGIWDFIDNGDAWYLSNGKCLLYFNNNNFTDRERKAILVDKEVKCTTSFRGRNFIGGIFPDDLFPKTLNFILEQTEVGYKPKGDESLNYVMWSKIGGGEFPLWLFDDGHTVERDKPYSDDYYNIGITDSYVIDELKTNQIGFMPMPAQCTVLDIKGLGKSMIVYTDSGIFELYPANVSDVPTFGLKRLSMMGTKGKGFIGGNSNLHIFISNKGYLYGVTSQGVQKLGYKEYFKDFEECLISAEPQDNIFHITDGKVCYIYEDGLGGSLDIIHSTYDYRGTTVGIKEPAVFEGKVMNDIIVVSHPFDFQERSRKTIKSIGIMGNLKNPIQVAIDYRYSYNEEFKRTHFVSINKEGNAYLPVSGVDFRLVIKARKGNDISLDYAQVRYQPDDKRFKRGINVNPNNT